MKSYKDYPTLNNDRINFSKISGHLDLPYLCEIQTDSYKSFLKDGIDEVFKDVFPIVSNNEDLTLEYRSFRLEEPKFSYLQCKEKDLTYSAPLTVTLALLDKNNKGQIVSSDVFMGDIPLMTDSGTFIVNGAERVIVSQIVRSPGAYLSKTLDTKNGLYVYNADLIPSRGTWLEFESDTKGFLWVRIDRQRKMPVTILLKALGFVNEKDIKNLFGDREVLNRTWEKDPVKIEGSAKTIEVAALTYIFTKLKPGEPFTDEGVHKFLVQKFFDEKRYDLGRAGRFKYKNKLGIYNRLIDRILAEDLIDANGEVKYTKGTLLTREMVEELQNEEFFEKGAHQKVLKVNDQLDNNSVVNVVKVYNNENKDLVSHVIGTDLNTS